MGWKRKSVYIKWLLSYFLILVLMICCSIPIYFYSYRTVNHQSVRINQMLLEKLKMEVDGHLTDIRCLLETLILSREVQKVTTATQTGAKQQEDLLALHREIINQAAANATINDIFIFLNNTDSVISTNGHMSSRQFYDLYYDSEDNTYEEFLSLMNRKWKWEVIPLMDSQGMRELVFVQTSLRLGNGTDSATVAVSVKESLLKGWFDNTKWDASVEVLALDDENRIFGNTELLSRQTDLVYHQSGQAGTAKIGGTGYQLLRLDSVLFDWEYILLVPVRLYIKSARRIQIFTLADMLVCLVTGSYAAFALTRAHYHPLRKVMELFGNAVMDEDKNEYHWLDAQARKLMSEKQRAARSLKRHYLFKLLLSSREGVEGKPLNLYGIKLALPYNLVLLIVADDGGSGTGKDETVRSMSAFIIENLLTELADGRFPVECVDLGEELACVINLARVDSEYRESIESVLEEVQKRVSDWFHFRITAYAGSVQEGIAGIHESFLHASEAGEYRDTLNGEDVIWYEDIRNLSCVYQYPMETEQKLINMICAGDGAGAAGLANQILLDNYGKQDAAPVSAFCLLFDLLGTVIRAAEAGGAADCLKDHEIEAMFSRRWSREQLEESLLSLIGDVSERIRQRQMEKREDGQFGRKVMEYVNAHYQEAELNVSLTAMAFDMTPSYLSALFKEQMGGSLLEYINRTRIEKAKELLSQDYTVAEAARLSGFSTSSVFIRIFKKMTGITPGQMKKGAGR